MPTEAKRETIEALRAQLDASRTMIISEYRGLKVKEITEIRRALRQSLTQALRHGKRHSQVYLELFCGTGGLSRVLEKKDDFGVVRLDLKSDTCFDLHTRWQFV